MYYNVTELARIYGVTRKTIYTKLENEAIKEYVVATEDGKKLKQEGLNLFNTIIANSKRCISKQNKDEVNTQVNTEINYMRDHIKMLEDKIEELKADKTNLQKDKEVLFSQFEMQNKIIENQLLLLNPGSNSKKSWWKFWL